LTNTIIFLYLYFEIVDGIGLHIMHLII